MKQIKLLFPALLLAALVSLLFLSGCGPKTDGVTLMDSTKSTPPPPKMPDNPNLPPEAKAAIQQRMQQGAGQSATRNAATPPPTK